MILIQSVFRSLAQISIQLVWFMNISTVKLIRARLVDVFWRTTRWAFKPYASFEASDFIEQIPYSVYVWDEEHQHQYADKLIQTFHYMDITGSKIMLFAEVIC